METEWYSPEAGEQRESERGVMMSVLQDERILEMMVVRVTQQCKCTDTGLHAEKWLKW